MARPQGRHVRAAPAGRCRAVKKKPGAHQSPMFTDTSRDTGGRVRDFSAWPFPPQTRVRVDAQGSHYLALFLRPTGSGMCEVAPLERSGVIEPTRFVRIALLTEDAT